MRTTPKTTFLFNTPNLIMTAFDIENPLSSYTFIKIWLCIFPFRHNTKPGEIGQAFSKHPTFRDTDLLDVINVSRVGQSDIELHVQIYQRPQRSHVLDAHDACVLGKFSELSSIPGNWMRDSYLLTNIHYTRSELVRNFSRWKSLTSAGLWVGTRVD